VNPDFGQVEADPAVVNLSAFESFFPEQRPFFVEGGSLFNRFLPSGRLFYSRRIGRPPQGFATAPSGGTVEIPEASTILSAAKVTGKTANGFGLGLLSAVTTGEHGTLRDAGGGIVGEERVQPWVHHFAGRAEQDFAAGQHTVGAMATALNRFDGADDIGLSTAAYTLEADGNHQWSDNTYRFSWTVAGSRIEGSEAAMLRAQRSSFRYYQRPDATHLEVDSAATSLSGHTAQVRFGKYAGVWRYNGWVDRTSSGFDVSDLGFMFGSVDRQSTGSSLSYWQLSPTGPFRDFQLWFLEWNSEWTTNWERTWTWFGPVFFAGNLNNNWSFSLRPISFDYGGLSVAALRGGPALRQPSGYSSFANISTDRRKTVSFFLGFNLGGHFGVPGHSMFTNLGMTVRPAPSVSASLNVNYGRNRNPDQWVGRETIDGTTRYILGEIQQRTLNTNVRLDWTLTPDLSFQLYAQPFVAAGTYSNFKEVLSPRADNWENRYYWYDDAIDCSSGTCEIDLDRDGSPEADFARPDFDVMSLRMTSVLRWEYMPGSVLFVAWQHGRADAGRSGDFDGLAAVPDLLRLPSDNTLLVKVSYWLGL
ncbi:MAG: DUF5916 domain-containing protein, partial [Rhodothermales bacterium]|nr:DUF5916 domain-containing protein [Rhodothermales bacterium]